MNKNGTEILLNGVYDVSYMESQEFCTVFWTVFDNSKPKATTEYGDTKIQYLDSIDEHHTAAIIHVLKDNIWTPMSIIISDYSPMYTRYE